MTGAWVWAGARAIGTAHVSQGLPCQDAFACKIWQRPDASPVLIAALADGAGSAARAEIGSALATSLFVDIVYEGFAASPAPPDAAHLLRYAVGEARRAIELKAGHDDRAVNDYATTLLMVILSRDAAVVGQIGDGAVVVPDAECGWRPVHWPDHGEYANTTRFLTEADALDALQIATLAPAPRRVCLFSDGLERLVLDFRNRSAHAPFFDSICSRLDGRADAGHAADVSHDLETLLTSDKVNSRTDDDKSLVCVAWLGD